MFHYNIYGLSICSDRVLPLPSDSRPGITQIEIRTSHRDLMRQRIASITPVARSNWRHYGTLADGSTYVGWDGVGDFVIDSAGRVIHCVPHELATEESFHVYLLGQAVSFALIKLGFEPLHATAVSVDGAGVAFLGGSGFGKSTLAAFFHAAGCELITDDILLVHWCGGDPQIFSGPPRVKLFSDVGSMVLNAHGGASMNSHTPKRVFPISSGRSASVPLSLVALYQLDPPFELPRPSAPRIDALPPLKAVQSLVGNTFNRTLVDSGRLQRQATQMTRLASVLGVSRLSYPRDFDELAVVREAVVRDLARRRKVLTEPR